MTTMGSLLSRDKKSILDDEDCRQKAAQLVHSNSSVKGKPNMTAAKFCDWVNKELLPNTNLPERYPKGI